jgi:hypothetical protein
MLKPPSQQPYRVKLPRRMFIPPADDVVLKLKAIRWQSSGILEGDTTRVLIVVARFLVGLTMGGSEPTCRLVKSGRDQHSSATPPTFFACGLHST